jgi:hypothetical protein
MSRAKSGSETMREAVVMEPVTMESVLEQENLNTAWRQVKANDGAAGVDGLDVRVSEGHKNATLQRAGFIIPWTLATAHS